MMRVVVYHDDLEEWEQFCKGYHHTTDNLGEDGHICYPEGGSVDNPSGWFDEDLQMGEVDLPSVKQ